VAALEKSQGKSRGRPRSFDRDAALRAAMETFWQHGYEGASMAELTQSMGINSPSLYAAFGSKEGLFQEALRLYLETEDSETKKNLFSAPTARAGIHAMLRHSARSLSRPGLPHGCMLILGDANTSVQNDSVRQSLCRWRRDAQSGFEERLRRGIKDGDVPANADVAKIAGFYMTILQGLSLRARDGAPREAMLDVADAAMAAWDTLISTAAVKPARPKRAAIARKRG
jgi:AcrR family transcriptional regulator